MPTTLPSLACRRAGCAGAQAGAGGHGAGRWARCRGAGAQGATGAAQGLGARPGRAAGQWAVHLVHSTCF